MMYNDKTNFLKGNYLLTTWNMYLNKMPTYDSNTSSLYYRVFLQVRESFVFLVTWD